MKFEHVDELNYITPLENFVSILKRGLLSHNAAQKHNPKSIADRDVQQRRADKVLPSGEELHSYVNLYFHARNPMVCSIQDQHKDLLILSIDRLVLKKPGTLVSDKNAASPLANFYESPEGLEHLAEDYIFAEHWTSPTEYLEKRKRRAKCAEALVPHKIESGYIQGVYVSTNELKIRLERFFNQQSFELPVQVLKGLFFQADGDEN